MEPDFVSRLRREAQERGVVLSPAALDQLALHHGLLQRWGLKINLVSRTDWPRLAQRHYGEAFAGASWIPPGSRRALDIGTGAGFPALPLAVLTPSIAWTLLEPRERRWAFLRQCVRQMRLNCCAVNASLSAYLREPPPAFDLVTARGVNDMASHLKQLRPHLSRAARVLWFTDAAHSKPSPGFAVVSQERLDEKSGSGLTILELSEPTGST